ncbi:S26 family signal peptidase [Candidatus Daviesbacteria bacterium]|nr:S26 family signal peptidase [Candidatus Daviesbacteria bacterium]
MTVFKLFFKISPIVKFQIKEESMYPFLKPGDFVLVNKLAVSFKINDLVILKNPENSKQYLVKKIKEIRNGKYFVIGENKNKSRDSRYYGWVNRENIIGKVFKILNS